MRHKRYNPEGNSGESKQFLTTNEIAEILRVHQRTVQRWISSNSLKAKKVETKILRVRRRDFDEFLDIQNKDHQDGNLDGNWNP
uniref:helix-turn-helix domain-containing protein n=1 Tax=Nostoc sp. UHCC 0870 TaxID=2914041 RepID=UPI0030DB581F